MIRHRLKILICTVLSLVLCATLASGYSQSNRDKLRKLRTQADRASASIGAALDTPRPQTLSNEDVETMERAIPRDTAIDPLINSLTGVLNEHNASANDWQVKTFSQKGGMGLITVGFMATCTSDALPALVQALRCHERLILIDHIEIRSAPDSAPDLLQVMFQLSAFYRDSEDSGSVREAS